MVWKRNFRLFILPMLTIKTCTTSSVLLEKELQKQMGTMIRMTQGGFKCPAPWLVLSVHAAGCYQYTEEDFLLHWGSA